MKRLAATALRLGFALAALSGPAGAAEDATFHAASPQFILEPAPPAHLPVRLEGVTLLQDGAALEGERPALSGGTELTVRGRWTPWTAMDSSVAIRIRLWDGMGLIAREFAFRAGPGRREAAWAVGASYDQSYDIPGDELGRAFSGDGYLEVAMETPRSAVRDYEPLMLLPVRISPLVSDGAISPETWAQAAGPGVRALNRQARLGSGASFAIDVPAEWGSGNGALAVASFLSYQSLKQGAPAGTVTVLGTSGEAVLPIRAGVETARCDYDAHAPGRLEHEKVRVFMSRDAAQVGYDSRPVQLHTYLATIALPEGLGVIERVTFACDSPVVLDIMGCALIPAE